MMQSRESDRVIMADIGVFYMSPRFQDATLLLGSDSVLLEQSRAALQATADGVGQTQSPLKSAAASSASKPAKHCSSLPQLCRYVIIFFIRWYAKLFSKIATRVKTFDQGGPSTTAAASDKAIASTAIHVQQIPVHRIILTTGSEYFRTAISTLVGHFPDVNGHEPMRPIIVLLEEDMEAAHGVLQFLYTQKLDRKFSTVPQLMRLLMVADRWVVPGCMSACYTALTALVNQLWTLDDALSMYAGGQGPLSPSLLNAPQFQPLLKAGLSKLLRNFGNIPAVIASPALTAQLLRLPHAAFLALLESDALTTDSEDSVLLLLSWWLEGCNVQDRPCSKELVAELQGQVRYSRLSPTFLAQALPLVPHLNPSLIQLSQLNEFRSFTLVQSLLFCQDLKSECPSGWFKPKRLLAFGKGSDTVSVTLLISSSQLRQYTLSVKEMEQGGPEPTPLSASVDFRGFRLSLGMLASPNKDNADVAFQWLVGVCACVRLPSRSSTADLQLGFPCSCTVSLHSNIPETFSESLLFTLPMGSLFLSVCSGWQDFPKVASNLPGDLSDLSWWDPFIVDGNVKLTAEFTDERSH